MTNQQAPPVMQLSGEGVTYPDLHDAALTGIVMMSPKEARLFFTSTKGHRYTLVLKEVEKLRADEFLEGNTVLRVSVGGRTSDSDRYIRWVYSLAKDNPSADSFTSHILRRLQDGELKMLDISASYGCVLFALCKDLEWRSDHVA